MDQDHSRNAPDHDAQAVSDRIRLVVGGDQAALEWIVTWLSPWMLAWANLQVRPGQGFPITAEDLVQDVWMRILPELQRLTPHPTKDRWTPALLGVVKRTLRNRVIDVRRNATRSHIQQGGFDSDHLAPQRVDSSSGPISKLLRGERQRQVQAALDQLTHRERALYVKRLFEDATIEELAQEFGMTHAAVVKARQRVRQRLTGFLAPQLLDELDGL